MRTKHIASTVIVLFMAMFVVLNTYHGGPWRGQVIDAETKQPIEGAAVVAVWSVDFGLSPAGPVSYYLLAEEKVTDKNGEFQFVPHTFLNIPLAWEVQEPKMTIFKPGYGAFPFQQVSPPPNKSLPINYFEMNNAVVELPKLNIMSREDYLKSLPITPFLILGHEEKIKEFNKMLDEYRTTFGSHWHNGKRELEKE